MSRFLPQVALVVLLAIITHSSRAAAPEGFDKYYGSLKTTVKATGFFRVDKINDQWWLITPEGHPFFSNGINGVSMSGTATSKGVRHYQQAAKKIYGTPEAWAEAQAGRCDKWGWNTIGAWSHWRLFKKRMPYTLLLSVGNHDWLSGKMTDIFAPEYRLSVRRRVKERAGPLVDDPWLVGYFLDNEMKWGPDHRGGHLFDIAFAKPAKTNATKRALLAMLEQRYKTIDALRNDFETKAQTWAELAETHTLESRDTPAAMKIRLDWAGKVAQRFFSVTSEELRAVDPNHLNLGVRFIAQCVPRPVIEAAGKYVDVMSINYYNWDMLVEMFINRLSPDYLPAKGMLEEHYRVGGRPILISEWGFRAADAGLPNSWPPIYPTLATQADRADAYEKRLRKMLSKPWIVGQHWFIYADQPPEGRFDGEDNNFGLVSEKDIPYKELTTRSAEMVEEIYKRLP